jgi:hypothetical protein
MMTLFDQAQTIQLKDREVELKDREVELMGEEMKLTRAIRHMEVELVETR